MFRTKLLSCSSLAQRLGLILAVGVAGGIANGQQTPATGSRFDVISYHIEAQLKPNEHTLRAGADVTFVPLDPTRSVVFELNGSLHVDNVEKDGKALTGFVQDAVGAGSMGPNVRIDMGDVVQPQQPVTLRIRW